MITDREFWMIVRMALIQIVGAIEKRWECKHRYEDHHPAPQQEPAQVNAVEAPN